MTLYFWPISQKLGTIHINDYIKIVTDPKNKEDKKVYSILFFITIFEMIV
jgi:hypothetical protein